MTTIIGTGEVGALHSREELEEMQRLPLQRKIQITTARIIEWYQHYDGKVYVAFSGGKDSTVLLDIVRRMYAKECYQSRLSLKKFKKPHNSNKENY